MSSTICCLNPDCTKPENPEGTKYCSNCGTVLIILRNHYRPIKLLSDEGGFGRTYLAEDLDKLQEICVIKQLAPQQSGTAALNKAQQLFELEARQLQKLGEHPQIPLLLAYFAENGYLYLVQQYINGKTLDKLPNQWNEQEIKDFLNDILPVLEFVHRNQVIHRDIKPTNIMRRDFDRKYILIDFGASKEFKKTVVLGGTTIGTPGYAAFEQMESGEATSASDLFGIGATCFYLFTGIDPYTLLLNQGYQWVNNWQEHLKQPISPQLGYVLNKLLQKEPRNRYQSAAEALKDLNYTPPQPTIIQTPPPQPKTQPAPTQIQIPPIITPPRRTPRRRFLKILGYSSIGVIAVSLFEWWRRNNTLPLKTFSFETVKLYSSGNITNRETKKAQYVPVDIGNGITLEMVKVAGGKFLMGSPESEEYRDSDERRHEETVNDFYIGKYEVTQEQWQEIMGKNPSYFNKGGKYPVESVSWYDCQEFCQKLSQKTGLTFRLPTEAEWEYACRAIPPRLAGEGTGVRLTPFYFGETLSTDVANYDGNYTYGNGKKGIYRQKTTEVGSFPANAWGLYDMHGNVWEWCQDDYQEYAQSPLNPPTLGDLNSSSPQNWGARGANTRVSTLLNQSIFIKKDLQLVQNSSSTKVMRGGSWGSEPSYCRSAYRVRSFPVYANAYIGLRVVCVVEKQLNTWARQSAVVIPIAITAITLINQLRI